MYKIKIAFKEKEKKTIVLRKIKPGESLLEVCLNHGIELGHDCGGICSCTTCHLHIKKGNEFLEQMSKREKDILFKKNKGEETSRLGCQCLLLDGSGEIEMTIPVQTIGESKAIST